MTVIYGPGAPRPALLGALALLMALALGTPVAASDDTSSTFLAELADPAIAESSGLVGSRRQPGVLWTHNDSGDGPHLYAVDRDGQTLGTFVVPGIANVDWEDLALGPGADRTDALYVADTGDNERRRSDPAIVRVPEPTVDPAAPSAPGTIVETAPPERFPIAYPNGPRDVEAMLLHPESGELLLVTKEVASPASVYLVPPLGDPDRPATLTEVATLALPGLGPLAAATGGAVAADGGRLLLRTPLVAVEWVVQPGHTLSAALKHRPSRIVLPSTIRGEAIAYRADGAALLLTTEGVPCPLHEVLLPPAEPTPPPSG